MGKGLGKAVVKYSLAPMALPALFLLCVDVRAEAFEAAVPSTPPLEVTVSFNDTRKVSEQKLARISGASASHGSPRLSQTGIAVILWDERTKVRGAISANANAVASEQTVGASLTVH